MFVSRLHSCCRNLRWPCRRSTAVTTRLAATTVALPLGTGGRANALLELSCETLEHLLDSIQLMLLRVHLAAVIPVDAVNSGLCNPLVEYERSNKFLLHAI